jgi:hypothetical protein
MFKRAKIDEIKIDGRRNAAVFTDLQDDFNDDSTFGNTIYFKIQRGGVDTFFFLASINDGKLDDQNDIFYITPRPNDSYEKILKGYSVKRNIPTAGVLFHPTIITDSFTDLGSGTWVDTGFSVLEWENLGVGMESASTPMALTVGQQVIVIIRDRTIVAGGSPEIYAVTAVGAVASNVASLTANGKYILTATAAANRLFISISGLAEGSVGYEIYKPVEKLGADSLLAIITSFLGASHLNTGLTAKSTIIWNDTLPSVKPPNVDTYITANPTRDYVLESTAIWNYLVLAKASAIVGTSADKYELSFKELMDMLKVKQRIFWYIDSGGFFRLEHERFFDDFDSQLDLTSSVYKPEVDKRIYNYEKSDIYQRIVYTESNQGSADWLDNFTAFDPIKTSSKVLDISPPQLSTDVRFMESGSPSNSGYMLLQCLSSYMVDVNPSVMTAGAYFPNVYLSWAWLRRNYYSYFSEADESLAPIISYSGVKRFKKQTGVKFYHDGILNWIRPVTLAGGKAWIDKMELDLASGWYTLDVGFDPY